MSESRNIPSGRRPVKNAPSPPYRISSSNDVLQHDTISRSQSENRGSPAGHRAHSRSKSQSQSNNGFVPGKENPNVGQGYNSNWTTLIPPLPVFPQPAYKPENLKLMDFTTSQQIPPYLLQNPKPSLHIDKGYNRQSTITQKDSVYASPPMGHLMYPRDLPHSNYDTQKASQSQSFFTSQRQGLDTRIPQAPTQEHPPAQQQPKDPRRNLMDEDSLQRKTSRSKKSIRRKKKICKGCGKEITGQFVRALNSAFHVECFCCNECGNPCSAKFFPYDVTDEPTGFKFQVALCEYDYFKKLDLICYNCNKALRGPYITALGNKYHLEHFKCTICDAIFESDESYYEHDSEIYCHYHYSKLFATPCEGCHSPIVKQFVELFRGGRNQQWHPECYMVHKFWNVCILADSVGLEKKFGISGQMLHMKNIRDLDIEPDVLMGVIQQVEDSIMNCWLILSGLEEVTASCISDMLLNACTSNILSGLHATGRLVVNIEVLFKALDEVQKLCTSLHSDDPGSPNSGEGSQTQDSFQYLKKEPRNICGKMMSYLALLRKSKQISLSGSLSTELLSVITGCAHYLKLMIRLGLHNALRVNKLLGSTDGTDTFLTLTKNFERFNKGSSAANTEAIESSLQIPHKSTDLCHKCLRSIEKSCVRFGNRRWHLKCFGCSNCLKLILSNMEEVGKAKFDEKNNLILCKECAQEIGTKDHSHGFQVVSDLDQLVYLLKIALQRSTIAITHEIDKKKQSKSDDSKSKALASINEDRQASAEDDYSKTLDDVTSLRTRRQSQKLSSIKRNARKSVILETPDADEAKDDFEIDEPLMTEGHDDTTQKNRTPYNRKASISSQLSFVTLQQDHEHFSLASRSKKSLKIKEEPQKQLQLGRTSDLLQSEKSLTLDDIPRIVAAEQAREQRPNAFKHHSSYQKQKRMQSVKTIAAASGKSDDTAKPSAGVSNVSATSSSQRGVSSAQVKLPPDSNNFKSKYYSELSKTEHFILRHIAVEALGQILCHKYQKETLLNLIQTRKQATFWDKFKFGDSKKDKNMNVFGVDLQDLTKKYGVDSDLGVGPSRLRIPLVIDDIISSLRQKDMSVEGIFRLNGNIKKLKDLTEQINKNPLKSPDFSTQSAIQLAALMKKWLRELPNPLLTYNLYDIWISSQRESDPRVKKRILQLAYCMLPRSHRNLVEVLLYFFSWVASFAEIDNETGSKMDIHNLATVITPNILTSKASQSDQTSNSGDNYFLAIEVVNYLIEFHEEFSLIPTELLEYYEKCGFNNMVHDGKSDHISTKEILNKLEKVSKETPDFFLKYDTQLPENDSSQGFYLLPNTISRGHSKVIGESHGETADV